MKFYDFLRTKLFFLLLQAVTISADTSSTDSRVKFSSFELSSFDCTVAAASATSQPQQVSPYIVAEQVRSIAEDCLRVAVPLDCMYGSVDYIGLGNAACEHDTITIRGGVIDFTSSDDIPSFSDVAQCLRTAFYSSTCLDMILSNFPSVTAFDYEYLTPAPAPVVETTESTNDEVSQPVQKEIDASTSQSSLSIATVLGAVGGGAVILALLGFMAALRQKKRSSSAIKPESYCVRNEEDLEGGIAVAVECGANKPCDEDDDAQTPTTLSLNDGSNSSFEEDVVVENGGHLDSSDRPCDSHEQEQPINVDAKSLSVAVDPQHSPNEMIVTEEPLQQTPLREQLLLSSNSTAENSKQKDDVVDSMKSWMGFHLSFQPLNHLSSIEADKDDFAPDEVWDPDDNSVSLVDLEILAIAGTGELSFAPSPQRKPNTERLSATIPSLKQESSHRRSHSDSDSELFPAAMETTGAVQKLSRPNSMPSFEKWNAPWSTHWKQDYESLNEPKPPPSLSRKYLARHACRPPKSPRGETIGLMENEI